MNMSVSSESLLFFSEVQSVTQHDSLWIQPTATTSGAAGILMLTFFYLSVSDCDITFPSFRLHNKIQTRQDYYFGYQDLWVFCNCLIYLVYCLFNITPTLLQSMPAIKQLSEGKLTSLLWQKQRPSSIFIPPLRRMYKHIWAYESTML